MEGQWEKWKHLYNKLCDSDVMMKSYLIKVQDLYLLSFKGLPE